MIDSQDDKIVIIGAGITGLVLARELSSVYGGTVAVIEKEDFIGGLSATFSKGSLSYDLGSHRIHGDFSKKVVRYIEDDIGISLLKRSRRGLLLFDGKVLRYPPTVSDFVKTMSVKECMNLIVGYMKSRRFFKKDSVNYQDVIIQNVGIEAHNIFYKDFAKKLWGIDGKEISVDGFKRRKTFCDFESLYRIITGKTNYFYYPENGMGEIAQEAGKQILQNNSRIITNATIEKIELDKNAVQKITLRTRSNGKETFAVSSLISTMPIDTLFDLVYKKEAGRNALMWRGMRIVYIHVDQSVEHENETFYFPSLDVTIGRVSILNKYSPFLNHSVRGTVLTVEIPMSPDEKKWQLSDKEVLEICLRDLVSAGILKEKYTVLEYFTLRLEKTYPVYKLGWRDTFNGLYNRLNGISNLFTIGRNGLFLHCNIDHCILQALDLAQFIITGDQNKRNWWNKKAAGFFEFSARD